MTVSQRTATTSDAIATIPWIVQSVRVTAFPAELVDVAGSAAGWYASVFDAEAETTNRRRDVLFEEAGPYGPVEGSTAILHVEPGRIDWFLQAVIDQASQWASVGDVSVVEGFAEQVNRWFAHAPDLRRLALGVILLDPIESLRAGYVSLQPLLPIINFGDPSGLSDFLVQFNRPHTSQITHEPVNRLLKASVASEELLELASGSDGPPGRTINRLFAVRMEVDTSTYAARSQPFGREMLVPILNELVGYALELAHKGDAQ